MFKKITALICVVVLIAVPLAGCGNSSGGTTTQAANNATTAAPVAEAATTQAAAEKSEISFIVATSYKDYFDEVLVKGINAKYPEVTVTPIYNNEPTVIIQQQLAAGAGPDVITTQGTADIATYARTSHILPIDAYASQYGWMDKFSSWSFEPCSFEGKLYALPGKVDTEFVYYNKEAFAANGWAIPTTYQELITLCENVKAAGMIPFSFGTSDYKYGNEWWWSLAFASAMSPDTLRTILSGDELWTSAAPVDAMQKMLNLYELGYINEKQSTAITIDAATELFSSGRAAMKMEGTWLLGNLTSQQIPTFDWGVFAMPSWNDGVPQTMPYALGIGVSINASSKNPDAAAKFLDIWAERDNQVIGMDYKSMGIPPVDGLDLSTMPDIDPHVVEMQNIMNEFNAKKATSYLAWTYWGPQTRVYTCENVDAVWLGQLSLDTFMAEMQKQADLDKEEGKLFPFSN